MYKESYGPDAEALEYYSRCDRANAQQRENAQSTGHPDLETLCRAHQDTARRFEHALERSQGDSVTFAELSSDVLEAPCRLLDATHVVETFASTCAAGKEGRPQSGAPFE